MAESEEDVKSLSISMKEESKKAGLKLNLVQTTKILASGPITSWHIDEEKVETVYFILFSWAPKSL